MLQESKTENPWQSKKINHVIIHICALLELYKKELFPGTNFRIKNFWNT